MCTLNNFFGSRKLDLFIRAQLLDLILALKNLRVCLAYILVDCVTMYNLVFDIHEANPRQHLQNILLLIIYLYVAYYESISKVSL